MKIKLFYREGSPAHLSCRGGITDEILLPWQGGSKAMVAESVNEAKRLENAMRQVRTERVVVVLHYAPILETTSENRPKSSRFSVRPGLSKPSTVSG